MKRRAFIAGLAGAAASWPLAARAQQEARVRRIGMLSEFSEAQMQPMISAFRQQLRQFGWKDESIAIDSRFAIIDAAQFQAISAALVGTTPDLVVAVGSRAVQALKDQTQTIPVVFTLVADPVAQGFVQSLANPGGNLTGLTNFEFSFAGKWLPRKGALVTSRMEVRSALGPATTRAGGIKSNEGRRPIMKIPFRVFVWPNPLIEAIKARAVHLGQLSPRS
jgi:putative tryptophan/tyrosine transport system substrate-binding protein